MSAKQKAEAKARWIAAMRDFQIGRGTHPDSDTHLASCWDHSYGHLTGKNAMVVAENAETQVIIQRQAAEAGRNRRN